MTKNLIRFIESYNNLPNQPTRLDYLNALQVKEISNITVELENLKKSIFEDLRDFGLFDLKDQKINPKSESIVSDGLTYSIEYQDSQTQNFVTYNCPDVYQSDFADNKSVMQILLKIDSIFGLEIEGGVYCIK